MRRLMPSVPMILILGGCATPGEKTAIGAGAGAAVGAGVGALAGGWEGAAIGAVVGGVAGGAIGNYLDKQAQELQQVANARRTETGILVNLKPSLLFSSDSAVLQPAAVEQLAQLGDILARYSEGARRQPGPGRACRARNPATPRSGPPRGRIEGAMSVRGFIARPVPGTAAGWSATHRPGKEGNRRLPEHALYDPSRARRHLQTAIGALVDEPAAVR